MKNDGWLTLQSIGERDWGAFKKPFTFTIEVQNVQELPSLPCQKNDIPCCKNCANSTLPQSSHHKSALLCKLSGRLVWFCEICPKFIGRQKNEMFS